jgi:hypothetical protein
MGIPEDQLTTWANIGAQETSKTTYATIKTCLDAGDYRAKSFCNFLQGSYGNDTNIRAESDVDVVMELTGVYYYDLTSLPPDQEQAFRANLSGANYNFKEFRADVIRTLAARFGADVAPGDKAIAVKANGNRRKADVLACVEHHKLTYYSPGQPEQRVDGICFFKPDGTRVVNYPRLHAQNLSAKNQDTKEWFKHLVRIFKNARQKLIADGAIDAGVAPSYYIEGLLYNVPAQHFGTNYATSMFECLKYLVQADRSKFLCANRQYPLLDGNADVTWNTGNCNAFIDGLADLWNQW